MPTILSINIRSTVNHEKEEIKFYEADDWSIDSEKQFIAKIQDVFTTAKNLSDSIHVCLTIETPEIKEVSFQIQRKINHQFGINNQKLSVREIEGLGFIMQGYTSHQIADMLHLSYETIKSHRKKILEKTGAKNTASLINYYHQTFFDK